MPLTNKQKKCYALDTFQGVQNKYTNITKRRRSNRCSPVINKKRYFNNPRIFNIFLHG